MKDVKFKKSANNASKGIDIEYDSVYKIVRNKISTDLNRFGSAARPPEGEDMREEKIAEVKARVLSKQDLGKNLRNARINAGYSVRQVLDCLQYIVESENCIYLWEEGKRVPKGDTLMIVLRLYKVDLVEFFTREIPIRSEKAVRTA